MSQAKLIVRRRIGDVETPVGAMLKLGVDAPGSFLFESIAGGERLGRYSFIGGAPQIWFRILDGVAETATQADFSDAKRFEGTPVEALRTFVTSARLKLKKTCRPWLLEHSGMSVTT
jgi:anthranilate synthase component 1